MFYRIATLSVFATSLVLAVPQDAHAQAPAAQHSLTAGLGIFNFDLSGTGNATAVSGRGTVALARGLAVEGNLLFAWPEQQSGPSRVTAGDAHLQYHWRIAERLRPYAGGGVGFLMSRSDLVSDNDVTLSVAGGARFDVSDRLSLLGEFRLRGVDTNFAGSTAEVIGGVSYRLGRL
jgi:opacity protein-like surface antigen